MRNTHYKGFTINLYLAFLLDLVHGVSFCLRWMGWQVLLARWTAVATFSLPTPLSQFKRTPDRPRYACMLFTIAPVVNYIKRTHVMSNEN